METTERSGISASVPTTGHRRSRVPVLGVAASLECVISRRPWAVAVDPSRPCGRKITVTTRRCEVMGGSNPWPRLTRRAFIQSAAAAGLLAACGNPAELAASPGDGSVDLSSATLESASGSAQTVYRIPGSIRSDGSREVSQEINDWIASIPNGTAGEYNKALFASDGIYWVDDTIEPFSKSYIVFAGNGSTFVRRNQLPGTINEIRARAHWRFNQCAFFRY